MCYIVIKVGRPLCHTLSELYHNVSLLAGISGTITSLACAPDHVGSTSLDRFFRLHEVASENSAKDMKARTLERSYTNSIPTVVVWDPWYEDGRSSSLPEDDEREGDEVWEGMEDAEDDGGDEGEEHTDDELSVTNSLRKKSRTR